MSKTLIDAFLACLPVTGLLLLCILVERRWPRTRYSWRDRLPGALFVSALPGAIILTAWPLQEMWEALDVPPLVDVSGVHPLVSGLVMLLLFDLLRYWEHRFEHRFFWPVHAVHHSFEELHSANSYGHPLQALTEFLVVVIPLSLIDTGGAKLPVALAALVAFQNLVIHSPIRIHLGPLRHLIVDSRFHRIHHSRQPEHFEHNFAILFSFWDRLFGTAWMPRKDEWPDTGVAGIAPPRNLREYLLLPFRQLKGGEQRTSEAAAPVS